MCENFVEHVMNKTKRKPKKYQNLKKKIVNSRKKPQEKPLHCKKTTTTYRLYHRFLKFLLHL